MYILSSYVVHTLIRLLPKQILYPYGVVCVTCIIFNAQIRWSIYLLKSLRTIYTLNVRGLLQLYVSRNSTAWDKMDMYDC